MSAVAKKQILAALAGVLALAWLSGGLYSCAARKAMEREISETPRDPTTGIVTGAEAVTLDGRSGQACLLVHGWVGSRKDFHDLGERLQQRGLTVRMMRLPGHGTTPDDLENREVDDLLEGVRREYLGLKKDYGEVTLIGFSLGGALSTLLASSETVDRLVLVAPFYEVTYRFQYVLSPKVWFRILSPFVHYVIKGTRFIQVNREEAKPFIFSYHVIPIRAVEVLFEAGRRASSPGIPEKVKCPVLLLQSGGDLAASPKAARAVFDRLGSRKKEYVRYEASNHHLLWDYDGPAAMDKIVEFVTAGDAIPP